MTWCKQKYFAKSKIYLDKSCSITNNNSDFLLFFSIFMECILRASLVSKNPALNANIDSNSIFFSSGGQLEKKEREKTVNIKQAFCYLKRMNSNITNDDEVAFNSLMAIRNVEMHGDSSFVSTRSFEAIIFNCKILALKIIESSEEKPIDILGEKDFRDFDEIKNSNYKNAENKVCELLKKSKAYFESLNEDEIQKNKNSFESLVFLKHSDERTKKEACPSCGNIGYLKGRVSKYLSPVVHENELTEELKIKSNAFKCEICGFDISGLEQILAAKLPMEFSVTQNIDILDYFGIDAEEIANEIIHERGFGGYEYQDE